MDMNTAYRIYKHVKRSRTKNVVLMTDFTNYATFGRDAATVAQVCKLDVSKMPIETSVVTAPVDEKLIRALTAAGLTVTVAVAEGNNGR